MDHTAIRTMHLSCHFGTTRAVDDLSIEVPKGIVFGFLGPNGSGKTTTIRLLLGLLEPKQGKAEVLGYDTQKQADQIRNQAGALLEHTGLYERLSAEDNLEFYGRINHLSPGDRRVRIQELLTHFDLWDRRQDRVGNWSRGMKQAQQTLGLSTFILAYVIPMAGVYLLRYVPEEIRNQFFEPILTGDVTSIVSFAMVILALMNMILYLTAKARFQRARLILNK